MTTEAPGLSPSLVEQVLSRLELPARPAPTLDGLRTLYAAWCCKVPFDNVRKLIRLRCGETGLLPGADATDFFEAWLRYGAGGTCWAGNGALHTLLASLGFASVRGVATMLVAPDIPPNHGTVVVGCEGKHYVVDASILHGEPLEISEPGPISVKNPAWGVKFHVAEGHRIIHWRPLHKPDGFDCRIDELNVPSKTFSHLHEQSRSWSPFNYQLYGRINRNGKVIGTAFGQRVEFDEKGNVHQRALGASERLRFVVEDLGIHEELAEMLPADVPTPPPPRRV